MIVIIINLFVFGPSLLPDHALYLSLIEINKEENSTSILVKVFVDDFQNAIQNSSELVNYEGDSSYCEVNRSFVEGYFNEHLLLEFDQNLVEIEYQKTELLGDSYRIYFKTLSQDWSVLNIKADYFMELFPTQQNIAIVTNGDQKRSCRLTFKESSCAVEF